MHVHHWNLHHHLTALLYFTVRTSGGCAFLPLASSLMLQYKVNGSRLYNLLWITNSDQIRSDQSLSRVWLWRPHKSQHATPPCPSPTPGVQWDSRSIESVMPSRYLILCHPLLLLLPIPPSIRVFSNESTLHMRWPKYCSFSLSHQSFQETPRTALL